LKLFHNQISFLVLLLPPMDISVCGSWHGRKECHKVVVYIAFTAETPATSNIPNTTVWKKTVL